MKINHVKQFVASNVSRFEKNGSTTNRSFYLYDKNKLFCGEFNFIPLHRSGYFGVKTSLSSTRIVDGKLKPRMQEYVHMDKDYVIFKDKTSDTLTKALPRTITTIRTAMDFVKDKFITVRTVSKLKNDLQRIGKEDSDFIYSDKFVIYEPLKEKPKYDRTVEVLREGTISDVKKRNRFRSNIGVPFIYW